MAKKAKTFADEAKHIRKLHEGRENDPVNKRTMDSQMNNLMALNKQAIAEKEMLEEELAGDALRYGGKLCYSAGGTLSVEKNSRAEILQAAKDRGMTVSQYIKKLESIAKDHGGDNEFEDGGTLMKYYRYGGDGDPIKDEQYEYGKKMGVTSQGVQMPFMPEHKSMTAAEIIASDPISGNKSTTDNGVGTLPPLKSTDLDTNAASIVPGDTQGVNRSWATAADMLPYLSDLATAAKKDKTKYPKINLERVNLERERLLARKRTDIARKINRGNARNANSSGQALSYLATTGAAAQENLMDHDLQSLTREEQMNTSISNREKEMNNQIKINEITANEQNEANRDTLKSNAVHGMSTSAQTAIKDKNLNAAHTFNQRKAMEVINQMFPQYQWGVNPENDQLAIQFAANLAENGQ